jgi:hypothetical protein
MTSPEIPTESVALDSLRPHPENYQDHPEDQLAHLEASIREFGFFRNVVIARDGTILAGHGACEAARRAGMTHVDAKRLDLNPFSPEALKVLALDNETGRFAERDDRKLTELLRTIANEAATGLVGTGYDEMMLANLLMVTRSAAEILDLDVATEWVGMPDYDPEPDEWKLIVTFGSEEDRKTFMTQYDIATITRLTKMTPRAVSGRWPIPDGPINDGGLRWEEAL